MIINIQSENVFVKVIVHQEYPIKFVFQGVNLDEISSLFHLDLERHCFPSIVAGEIPLELHWMSCIR